MFGSSAIFRGLGSIPNFLVTRLVPPSASVFSTTALRRQESAMFTKAVRDHADAPKPLFTKPSLGNVTRSIVPNPTAGFKRKLDVAYTSESPLGSLHSAVYFDENDFDDDEDLDLDGSPAVSNPTRNSNVKAQIRGLRSLICVLWIREQQFLTLTLPMTPRFRGHLHLLAICSRRPSDGPFRG
jgi:hypothetical protein